jgi:hypothetical protein
VRHPRAGGAGIRHLATRRDFLLASAGFALWPLAQAAAAPALRIAKEGALSADLTKALETSPFVYVSPLKKGGAESSCHGEVWFAWLDGSVLVNSRRNTWKVKALQHGLDRARIWVGDHGRWKPMLGGTPTDAFRKAPSFDARASFETDRKWNDQLIALYENKYKGEFGRWREDMQTGFYSGQRMLIRYTPV